MATTVTYPAKLPLPLVRNYGVEPGEAILRTDMEAGPARQRRRFTQVPTRIAVMWRFNATQMALFEAWYKHQAKEGGEWFRVSLLNGLGLVEHEARFTKQYKAGLLGGTLWDVTSELEIRERPTITADALAILLTEDFDGLSAAIDATHTAIHTTLPANPW